jgi:hypothetical protein
MHGRRRTLLLTIAATVVALSTPGVAVAGGGHHGDHEAERITRGLDGGSGSTIGPDGELYVTEPVSGQVTRIDRRTGDKDLVADCLPKRVIKGIGGAMDVAFLGHRMYVLTAVVSKDVGGKATTGIYRVKGRHDCDVVADIGRYNIDHPARGFDVMVKSGVPYAMEPYRGGFLVTDGHINRVLKVDTDGDVRRVLQLRNVVPTGLERTDGTVLVALAGPVPHRPRDGKVIAFRVGSDRTRVIASGARLLVDVESGRHHLYALSQGVFPRGGNPGAPARPDTGRLLRVDDHGFDTVAEELDRPTSLEIVDHKAYVVTYDGEVWRVSLRR